MMENKTVIINSIFNVKPYLKNGIERYTLEWIEYRIKVFQEFTLKSLKLQTNQNFNFFICYEDATEDIIKSALNKYDPLPENIHFICKSSYYDEVKKYLDNYKYVYIVRLDSDDAYHKSFIQQLYDYKPKEGTVSLINRNGYIYDSVNEELGKCYCKVVTFYTFIYKVEDYLNGNIYNKDFTDIDNEQYIALRVPHEFIENRNYLWHIHNKNTITNFDSWFTKIDGRTKNLNIINKIVTQYIGDKN